MSEQEFKTQIFKTPEQWESGLLYRLESLTEGGITLYPVPTFVHWLQGIDETLNPTALTVDVCGQLYFIDTNTCRLYRYDPEIQWAEKMCIGGCGSDAGNFSDPVRILFDRLTMWVVDAGNQRVQAFSKEHYQIKYILDAFEGPIDAGLDSQGFLYILDQASHQISKYENTGRLMDKEFDESQLKAPIRLVVGKDDVLYVIDSEYDGFLTFTPEGEFSGCIGKFSLISSEFQPTAIVADKDGNIFVGDESGAIYQFDPDGSHVGTLQIPDFTDPIRGLAADSKGNLYASADAGIIFLSAEQRFTQQKGIYYSKTLDSGIRNCQWHRLALDVDLPPKTVLEVYFYADDSLQLREALDENLSDPGKSTQQKAAFIEGKIPENLWVGPEKNPEDMLFKWSEADKHPGDMLPRGNPGRYLWLKLVLSTFDEKVRPTVTQMKLSYPRSSYLRYLPAIYQEDPVSKEFLERFLSLFETVFYEREIDINHLFTYFDPESVPPGFLEWLASWLNMGLEEEWPAETKRQFIREASILYKLKGTPDGMRKFIEIYTGKQALILEHSRLGKALILRKDRDKESFRLGIDSMLIRTPVRGFRLGDDSILGRAALRDNVQSPEDPFLQMAHRFTIILDLSTEEWTRYETGLRRIVDEQKPAHTVYNLRIINYMRVGMGMYVGINTRVTDHRPMRLGADSILGTGLIVFDNGETAGKVERRSKVATDTLFI